MSKKNIKTRSAGFYIRSALLLCIAVVISIILMKRQVSENKIKSFSGKISAECPGEILESGNYRFVLTVNDSIQLQIFHVSNTRKCIWQSVKNRSFIMAASGKENVEEARGSFFITDDILEKYEAQSVEKFYVTDDALIIKGSLYNRELKSVKYNVVFKEAADKHLKFDININDNKINRIFLNYGSSTDENFYGFGEQFTAFNLKGRRLPLFIMEQGIGRGKQPLTFLVNMAARSGGDWHTSYAGIPHYITNKNRSLFFENYEYSVFDFRKSGQVQYQVFSNQLKANIYTGNSPKELIKLHTSYTGRMRKLPDWIIRGAIVGIQGGTKKVSDIYEKLKKLHTPVAGFWLQDWVGQRTTSFGKQLWWNWQLDKNRYPGWPYLHPEFRNDKIKILSYISPFLVDVSENKNHTRNLFAEARDNSYLIKNSKGEPYLIPNTDFSAGMVDLTNPGAYKWMQDVIRKEMIKTGVKGWMADFGEALPYDARLYSGESPRQIHNMYPELWAKLNREVIDSLPHGNEYVFFMRAGYSHSPAYSTLFWLGDQMVTWDKYDGIKSAVTGLLSSGISGFAYNHSDIGGYTAITNPPLNYKRSRELLLRWMEMNAFTTIYRTHEGNRPDENYQFFNDPESLRHFARNARIYNAWYFYRKQLVAEAAASGIPVIRHLFLEFPDDKNVQNISYGQFMIGSEFIVVPVLDKGEDTVEAYLPKGKWVHLWTQKTYNIKEGKKIKVKAPIGEPAVFYHEKSAVAAEFVKNLKAALIL